MRILVSIETLTDAQGCARGCISVEDDGEGFEIADDGTNAGGQKSGRGLRNMKNRAARCGAELDLSSGAAGTRVRLTLPTRFPDGDASSA